MTQHEGPPARPAGWIGQVPGFDPRPGGDLLPPPREVATPPRWLFHGICAAAALWVLWKYSTPVPTTFAGGGAMVLLVIAAAIWLVRLVIAVVERAPVSAWWTVAPIGGTLTLALLVTQAPMHARFSLADGRLEEIAQSVAGAPDPAVAAKELGRLGRVGTLRVGRVEARDGVVYFTLRGGDGFLYGDTGVAYVPTSIGLPRNESAVEFEHLRGPWYVWSGAGD